MKCKVCGGTVKTQGTEVQLDEWMKRDFGECPAGGRHVELGKNKDYLTIESESDALSEIPKWEPRADKRYVDIHKVKGLRHCGFGVFADEKGNIYDYELDEKGSRHYYVR